MKDDGCFTWAIILVIWFSLWGIFGIAMGEFIVGLIAFIFHSVIIFVYGALCSLLAEQCSKRRFYVFALFFFLYPFIAHILWMIHVYSKTDFWGLGFAQFYGIIIGCATVLYLPVLIVAIIKNIKDEKDERRIVTEIRDKVDNAKAFEKSQKNFSKYCRDQRDKLAPTWGCYNYDFYQYIRYNASVWQLFNNEFCSNDKLDYTLFPRGIRPLVLKTRFCKSAK